MQQELDISSKLRMNKKTLAPRQYPHTPEEIAKELRVDENGDIWWNYQVPRNNRKMNKPIGSFSTDGYLFITLNKKKYANHTIAFCLYHNKWPDSGKVIDHINGIRTDNRKENLREVSHSDNLKNRHNLYSNNKSGHYGVCADKQTKTWNVYIRASNGKNLHKRCKTLNEAVALRLQWEKEFNYCTINVKPLQLNEKR